VACPAAALAAVTVGAPVTAPAVVPMGQATQITVTSQIVSGPTDPAVIPSGVYLQRLDATGAFVATLGTMRDDGTLGDTVAGDKVFTLRLTVTEAAVGQLRLRVSVPLYKVIRRVFSTVSVVPIASTNRAPEITSQPITQATVNFGYVYRVTASDPEGGLVSFALGQAPAGMAIDPQTGEVSWTPLLGHLGNQEVVVRASDAQGAETTQAYVLSVEALNLSPIISTDPVRSARAGEEYRYDVDAFEPEGEPVVYEFAADPPAGMAINPQSGLVVWTAGSAGEYPVAVRARDPGTGADVQSYVVKVVDLPLELFSPAGAFQAFVGDTLTLSLAANYDQAGFSVDPLPDNATLAGATFTFTPAAGQQGVHTMAFQAHYAGMHAGNVVVINVARHNHAPEIVPPGTTTVNEGEQLALAVEATDADGDALVYSAPGLTLPNAYFNQVTHQLTFTPSFEQAGSYSVAFAVSDGEATATATATIDVVDVLPPAVAIDLVVDPLSNPTFRTTQTIAGSVSGQVGPPPAPPAPVLITGLSPASVRQGRSVVVDITGLNTQFATGSSTVTFGDGITVDSFEVLSPTLARASIRADRLAAVGPRTVRVLQGGSEAYAIVAFTVEPGTAVIAGTVLDPFTQQPLANARVGNNGTTRSVQTDAQGHFTLDGVAPGSATVLITLPNYEVKKIDLAVGANDTITFGEPIGVNALARPASPGGSLPRAATVASVIDRGVTSKGGGLTVEQAKMLIADTLVAVGGDEVGVLDEAGNQLNPKIAGVGDFSLTPLGVQRHAQALAGGDVHTLKDFVWALQEGFNFPTPISVQSVLTTLQDAVNQAWANPADPRWSMAIVLFNEGTTLSASPPILTPDTRINRFQGFLLVASFLLDNLVGLDRSAQQILDAYGVDWRSTRPAPTGGTAARSLPTVAARRPGEGANSALRPGDLGVAAPAYAQVVVPSDKTAPQEIGDLMARKSFTNLWRASKGGVLKEALTGANAIFHVTFAVNMLIGWLVGSSGGIAGAVAGLGIAAAMSFAGFLDIAFYKIVLTWFLALAVSSYEPQQSLVDQAQLDTAGNLVITIERSESERQTRSGSGPSGIKTEEIGYTYQLYRFPNCVDTTMSEAQWMDVPAQLVMSDPTNQQDPPLGKLQFIIPRAKLLPGANHFRVVAFQYIHNANKSLIEGASHYDTDDDHRLTREEFRKQGLFVGDAIALGVAFDQLDTNHDGYLDDDEFTRTPVQTNPVAEALGRDNDEEALRPFVRPPVGLKAGVYAYTVDQERQGIHAQTQERWQYAKRDVDRLLKGPVKDLVDEEDRIFNLQLKERYDFRELKAAEELRVEKKVRLGINATSSVEPEFWDTQAGKDWFRSQVGSDPTPEEIVQLKNYQRANTKVIHASFAYTNNGVKDLTAFRNEVEATDVPPGQSKILFKKYSTITDSYTSERGGTTETKLVSVVVHGGPDGKTAALADIDAQLSVEEGKYKRFLIEYGTADTEVRTRAKEFFSQDFLQRKDALNQLESDTAIRNQAIQQEKVGLQEEYVRLRRRERMLRRELGVGPTPDLEAPPYVGAGAALDVMGAVVVPVGIVGEFLSSIQTMGSEPSDCVKFEHSGVPLPSEEFPASIVPHPDQAEASGVLRGTTDPENRKGGYLERQYPVNEEEITRTEAGFPPAFLTTDLKGRVYADNRNSNGPYSGRLFRFTPIRGGTREPGSELKPLSFSREFVGTINYYSLMLQMGRPAFPVAMLAGPPFEAPGEQGGTVQAQDLFVADIDVMDGFRRILQVPVSLTDSRPGTFSEESGNRQRIVGQPYLQSDEFVFTGPSDMELGPDVTSGVPIRSRYSVMLLSDEEVIFAIYTDPFNGEPQLRRVIELPLARWSGLAFDLAGKFYFADFARGVVWVMTWDRLRNLIWGGPITDMQTLQQQAYVVARGLDRPGDIEVEQGSSTHRGEALFISTYTGLDMRPLPVVGRLATPVKDMKIKRFLKEEDVQVLADGRSFIAVPTFEDLALRQLRLRMQVTDPGTMGDKWVERTIVLADRGVTILENFQP